MSLKRLLYCSVSVRIALPCISTILQFAVMRGTAPDWKIYQAGASKRSNFGEWGPSELFVCNDILVHDK